SVPESTKEVEKPSELPPRTRSITKLSGIAMAVVVSVVVLLSLEMALWLFKAGPLFMFFAPEEAQALSDKGVGFIAALCLLVSIMAVGSFFSWPSYLLDETCSRQCRYMLGAESWSW